MAALKTLDDSIKLLATRNYSVVAKACMAITQKEACRLLGQPESSFSEWKDDHLERAMQVVAALGLKVVPKEDKALPPAEIAAYKVLAKKAMDMEEAPITDFGQTL